ncbi:MAG: hypothetical protein ABMA13_08420 [Chthoniobacteraceae bacterium]
MKLALATLYAIPAAVLSALVLAFARGQLDPAIAATSLGLGAVVGAFSLWSARAPGEKWSVDPWGGTALVVFALFALRSFLWLVFESGDSIWVFSPNNLGDLSLHLSYVRYLANGAPFWPENPIFAGAPLTYPVGIDLLNSLLLLLGLDALRGFVWVGLIGSACTAAMLWRWGRGFAVAGFLFAGGTLGFQILVEHRLVDYQSDAAWDGLIVAWKSLPLAIFVTQRGFLFALPAGLALLASWRARFLEPERRAQRLPLWGEWLLYAAMPVFHFHTFLFLSFIVAVWFCFVPAARRHLALVVALAFVPATALVWCVTGGFHAASMIGWLPGWMQPRGEDARFFGIVWFWISNFGAFLPLTAWLLWRIARRREPLPVALLAVPGVVVFVVCCFVKFAQWEWDNTKLMIWAYLIVLPAMWAALRRQREWVQVVACVLLFFSGAASLIGGLAGTLVTGEDRAAAQQPLIGYPLATRSEVEGAAWATRGIPITDRFIANPNYNHPLLLAGRLVTMGYEGHVASHGLGFAERKADVERVLNGEPGWRETAQRLGARWLFWGEQERGAYPDSPQPWRDECRVRTAGEWGTLYDLGK